MSTRHDVRGRPGDGRQPGTRVPPTRRAPTPEEDQADPDPTDSSTGSRTPAPPPAGPVSSAAPPPGTSDLAGWLRTAATFAPPLTVGTALMFYFGWVRAWEESRQLGIDVAVLGMTTQDYLLDSIAGLWRPVGLIALLLLAWLVVHRRLLAAVRGHTRGVRRLARGLQTSWLVLPLAAFLVDPSAFRDGSDGGLLFPAAVAVGFPLAAYGAWLGRLARGTTTRLPGLATMLVGTIVAAALFWELSGYGQRVGTQLAMIVADPSKNTQPRVVVYSPKNLEITAPGVVVTAFHDPDSAYGFRYSGLRLLQRSGGKYFLLPDGWSPDKRIVLVIPDDGTVRFEFGTG